MSHDFLILCLLFYVPGAAVFALRPDLRIVIGRMSIVSFPFALTESLFYPEYWQPKFLFDLADRIGFGFEDILFVTGLAAFTSTGYAVAARARYVPCASGRDSASGTRSTRSGVVGRALSLLGVTFALVAAVIVARVPMIYGACAIMCLAAAFVCLRRPDLALPTLAGGAVATAVYTVLCLAFGWLFPDAFRSVWKTTELLGVFVLGVPLEEILYGFAAGAIATAFYPYVWELRFTRGE